MVLTWNNLELRGLKPGNKPFASGGRDRGSFSIALGALTEPVLWYSTACWTCLGDDFETNVKSGGKTRYFYVLPSLSTPRPGARHRLGIGFDMRSTSPNRVGKRESRTKRVNIAKPVRVSKSPKTSLKA